MGNMTKGMCTSKHAEQEPTACEQVYAPAPHLICLEMPIKNSPATCMRDMPRQHAQEHMPSR